MQNFFKILCHICLFPKFLSCCSHLVPEILLSPPQHLQSHWLCSHRTPPPPFLQVPSPADIPAAGQQPANVGSQRCHDQLWFSTPAPGRSSPSLPRVSGPEASPACPTGHRVHQVLQFTHVHSHGLGLSLPWHQVLPSR